MKLLKESTNFDYKEENIVRKDNKLFLRGIIQKADTLNQNGRIYPRKVLERAIRDYMKLVAERRSTGEANHPDTSSIDLDRISHVITEIEMIGNDVVGVIEILDSQPCGKIVKGLIESKIKLGISSRGLGSVKQHFVEPDKEILVVQDDYQLICWDIVADPSTPGAWLSKLNESSDKNSNKKLLSEDAIIEELQTSFFRKSDRINSIVNDILSLRNSK